VGPEVGALIGISSLDWLPTSVPRTSPPGHERYLRAELGPDLVARLSPSPGAKAAMESDCSDDSPERGLFARVARALASFF